MKKSILLLLFVCLSFVKIFSQCAETTKTKVLLVGDSWAWFMNTDGTINNVLKTWGFSNYNFYCNSNLAINGADTKDFVKPAALAEILNQLNLHPDIKAVHLSIGGNDFLGDWNKNMTLGQTDTLAADVFVRLDSIIHFIQTNKPGIKILWSGYCYTNFKEVITNFAFPTSHPFYGTWDGMGQPDFIQINTLQNYISTKIDDYCTTHPGVYYVNANSLMQYEYGQSNPLQGGVTPTGTYAPLTQSIPLGDPNFPSPRVSMRDYGITKDCYHLSPEAYRYLIGYHTQKFYHKLLMDDLYLLADSTQSGSVSMSGNVTDSLFLGDAGSDPLATVLSFNTIAMADTALSKASLFLRRQSLNGTNPVGNSVVVKVKSGSFGATVNVEAADYTAADDANGAPCLFGSNTNNGDWVRLDLPASILAHINHTATTQFIITSPGATGKTTFYGTKDVDFAPVLNLVYYNPALAVNEINKEKEFLIYPNPTSGLLSIEKGAETITHLEVCNLLGEVVLVPNAQQNTINLSSLAQGMYMLNITTKNGKTSQRVFKD